MSKVNIKVKYKDADGKPQIKGPITMTEPSTPLPVPADVLARATGIQLDCTENDFEDYDVTLTLAAQRAPSDFRIAFLGLPEIQRNRASSLRPSRT